MSYPRRTLFPMYNIVGLVSVALLLSSPASLMAHGILIRAVPAVNSQIAEVPGEIRLWFNESVEHRFSRVTVHRAVRQPTTGKVKPQEQVDAGLADGPAVTRELAVKMPERLPPGLYLVRWKVLSIDSHRTTGNFTVTYDPGSPPPKAGQTK